MPECECTPKCPFFNGKMAQLLPNRVEAMKERFCLGDKMKCARYTVRLRLSPERVPADLVPNDMEAAQALIAAG